MKRLQILATVFMLNICSYAQSTTLTLPTANNTSNFNVTNGSTTLMKLNGDAGFYIGGAYGTGTIPTTGGGIRMMWYPAKGAFRAGGVSGTEWDDANVGQYSIALGYRNTASDYGSTALGFAVTATQEYSLAMGYGTTASGQYSTAMGYITNASGDIASTAMGYNTTASGVNSTAMGYHTTASGANSTATGYYTTASGSYSTAMGSYVSTNGYKGSFILSDYLTTTTNSTAENQMTMRFAGGYRLFTSSDLSTGMTMSAGANGWSAVSDSTKKENTVKADGEYFLESLAKLKIGSWNYKTQDPKQFRHYGPMAQEIFHYFGKDELGTIGNDTTLCTTDMDGIMMICLQALEKRSEECRTQNVELKLENEKIKNEIAGQNNKIAILENSIEEMKALIAEMVKTKESSIEIVKN